MKFIRSVIALLFLLAFANMAEAQPRLDSLLRQIKNEPDTAKAGVLSRLCWQYRSLDPTYALTAGEEALKYLNSDSDLWKKSEVLNYLGVIHGNIGNLDKAYFYYSQALDISTEINDSTQIGYCYDNIGDYYAKNALYSTALEYFMLSFKVFEKINNKQGMAYALNDMGEVYLFQNDYDKALYYFEYSGRLRKERNDLRGYAKTLLNLATVYEKQNKLEESLKTFLLAVEKSREAGYVKGESGSISGISEVYIKQGQYAKALTEALRALEIDKKIKNKHGEIINYNRTGRIYLILDDLTNAEKYLMLANNESQITGHLDQLMVSYEYLTKLYESRGDYRKAFHALREYNSLKDKIHGQESIRKMGDLQTAFVTERKDNENKLLKKDLEYQKSTNRYTVVVIVLVLGLVILFISKYRVQKKANALLSDLNNSKDRFLSIIAHDLKNPFWAISNLIDILESDYDEMDEKERKRLIKSLLRSSTEVSRLLNDLLTVALAQKGEIRLNKKEISAARVFNSIITYYEPLAKNKKIEIVSEADSELVFNADPFIVETVIGNFVNNAVKYSNESGKIILRAGRVNGSVLLSVEDFGVGMSSDTVESLFGPQRKSSLPGTKKEKGAGIGLRLAGELAKLHNAEISVQSEPGKGSKFSFKVPQ